LRASMHPQGIAVQAIDSDSVRRLWIKNVGTAGPGCPLGEARLWCDRVRFVWICPSIFFSMLFPKILIPKNLRLGVWWDPGKILSRKDLQLKYSGIRT
jgi:hypothetical protein